MADLPVFSAQALTSICKILADPRDGLSGSEIGYLLQDCRIKDVDSTNTKWKRLFNAFVEMQNERQFGNHVLVFIKRAMDPSQYTERPEAFTKRKDALNKVLAFSGYYVRDDGQVGWANKAKSLDEAIARADRLRSALQERQVHKDVLQYCKAEWLQNNYFHAVFEAMKSVSVKIRSISGLEGDGAKLVDATFGFVKNNPPVLAINSLQTETLIGEQRGFANLLKGLYGTVRNPLAHEPKLEWDMSEQDALDILTTLSLIHRKLDKARKL